jgi:hypothetical protein
MSLLLPSANVIPSRIWQPITSSDAPPLTTQPVVEATSSVQCAISAASSNHFMPEDAQFFNNLYSLNVLATEIATMMETMRTEWEAGMGSGSGAIQLPDAATDLAPPGYDFKG